MLFIAQAYRGNLQFSTRTTSVGQKHLNGNNSKINTT